ncbi:TolC family protein [Aquimarina sp. MMG016]|uniref:TolC family protein n=1 Tax=Aquimarina sp. MMG016 TaxID=2822690 RepID=UPI001B3A29D1|nr:TolC family protein [Aquimarina sp. MMG016]MBQ4820801.1 TolC family protein [Aquimarina sp. MMG016]
MVKLKYNEERNYRKENRIVFLLFSLFFYFSGNSQTLQDYIREAEQNNPQLKAMQYTYEAALEKVNEAGSLPNTSIGAGYFVSEPETRTGAQKAKFTAKQSLPWFGTLKAKKNKETSTSEVFKNDVEILRRKIGLDVKRRYYELYSWKAKEKILKQQKELLSDYKEITISEVANNKASAVDVLKINIAQNELDNKIEIIKGNILNAETSFNKILDRDGFEDLIVPDNLIIPDEEPTMSIDDVTYHPELLKYDNLSDMVIAQQKVNDKERLPGLSVGLDYVVVEERPDQTFSDNGKDIVMPMLSLSIPLFSKKFKSKDKQFELKQEGYSQQREAEQNKLEEILEKAINNRITARINYTTQVKNIEQANQAEQVALSMYQTNQLDFNELLEIQEMILGFELKKITSIKDYFIQTAIINYLE